jgi:AcrR family transcriptional regulator
VAAEVARHLPAAGGVPDVDGVMQVKVLDQVGKVVGVVVHVVALADLCGAAVPAPVMGDHPVAVVQEEKHLDVPADRPRREEYADQTRAAVIAAARQLFAENGFFQTKVDEIAKLSRVSPATVYAQCGGKQGLLRSLMDSWTQAPLVAESLRESLAAADAALVMQTLGTAYLQITKRWGDVIRVVIDVAPHDSESAMVLATAQRRHNRNLTAICRHLADIGALRDDVDARLAARIITYYYGIDGLLRTREVFGWSLERSNEWALAHASAAVLRSTPESSRLN